MTSLTDQQLFEFSPRVKDSVVLITGAANGIGRQTALKFASYGAKIVIADTDISGARAVVSEIVRNRGAALSTRCDVTVWEDVVALYELAIREYGKIDIVVANAGVNEKGQFHVVKFENGKPVQPNMTTLNVNLFGLLNTVHLAQHYLALNRTPGDLKAIVMLGSMASWMCIPEAPLYTAAKHAVLGIMRSLHPLLEQQSIRIGVVHPFFADTAIVPLPVKIFLAGMPLTPVERIAGAIFYAASSPSPETNGSAFLLPDDGPVFMVPKEEFKLGVYQMIDERRNSLLRTTKGIRSTARLIRDLSTLLWKPLFGVFVLGLAWRFKN